MSIIIADYGMGNLQSIVNMFRKAGAVSELCQNPDRIALAKKIILPGVGSFDKGMYALQQTGIKNSLIHAVEQGSNVLGICLGMQLLMESSEEGTMSGLGFISGNVVRFSDDARLKVPHMGWNQVKPIGTSFLFRHCNASILRYYFVHSYYVKCTDEKDIIATTDYGVKFTSALSRNNIHGVQFHPEKSHRYGLELFRSFVEL